jgi:hypothetical protein
MSLDSTCLPPIVQYLKPKTMIRRVAARTGYEGYAGAIQAAASARLRIFPFHAWRTASRRRADPLRKNNAANETDAGGPGQFGTHR